MNAFFARLLVMLLLASAAVPAAAAGSPADALRDKLLVTYAKIASYKITVLGSVRSNGVYVAPDRYAVSTVFEGKPVKTVFAGGKYWIFNNGKWEKSDTASDNLRFDIAGLLRNLRINHNALVTLPNATVNGRKAGTFGYTFKNDGSRETCNYDLTTYRVMRCKTDQLTVLYSGFNASSNKVTIPK
ncbi:MAG: hypothetical protein GIW95_00490 [Candidatus Eremiobacteraeota bacterium]|nr:hypothetical protein [Candidatus Eremiobacteraeota bacterium]